MVPKNDFWGFHFAERRRKSVDFTAFFDDCQTFIHFPKTVILNITMFRGKPHYPFWGKPLYHSVFLRKFIKIAILMKKSAVCKASRRKKRPCKEFPCRVFLLFALPWVLLMGFAQEHSTLTLHSNYIRFVCVLQHKCSFFSCRSARPASIGRTGGTFTVMCFFICNWTVRLISGNLVLSMFLADCS